MDVNAVDNIGSTPLHEAVNHRREEAVQLLLSYRALPTLDRFVTVTPAKGSIGRSSSDSVASSTRTPGSSVNLLALAGDGVQFSPLQDAVENGSVNIVKMILGSVKFFVLCKYHVDPFTLCVSRFIV